MKTKTGNPLASASGPAADKQETSGVFAILDKHFSTHYTRYMWGFTIFALLMALGSFQGKMSIANDDALYVVAGYRMGQDPVANPYTFTAPLYIMLLALLTSVFGLNLLVLKVVSLICYVGSVPLFFRAFRDKVPATLVMCGMFLFTTNWLLLEYASYTFTEAFFLLLFAWLFLQYSRYLDLEDKEPFGRKLILSLVLLGFITMLIVTTRNVAVVVIPVIVFLFFIRKKFKEGLVYGVALGAFVGLRELLFHLIWGDKLNQYKGQGSRIMYKDYYSDAAGKEDFAGLLVRFKTNCAFYTERFLETLGFIDPYSAIKPGTYGAAAFLFASLLVAGLVFALLRRNRMVQFVAFFALSLLGATFVALQTSWAQHRFIAVYVHLIAITILFFLYILSARRKVNLMQVFVLLVFVITGISSLMSSLKRLNENIPVAIANLQGDKYKGYTPDWVNFLKAGEWCAKNLPADAVVASRKEPMSYLYSGGRNFFPIYKIPADSVTGKPIQDADAMVEYLRNVPVGSFKGKQVDYFMLAQLRLDLKRKIPGRFINTLHNTLYPIEAKYPGCLKPIHTEGRDEITQIVKLDYRFIDSMRVVMAAAPPAVQDPPAAAK
ncbi:MAG: hypothetical protein IBJ09_00780 [Bacteroidia bacterium]|nr:hypothetical protein [Bacteroidia bacterium]